MSAVWELAIATLGGALFGAAGVHRVVRWRAARVPLLRARSRRMSRRAYRRLEKAFLAKQNTPARFVDEPGAPSVHELGGERGPKLATGGIIRPGEGPVVGWSGCSMGEGAPPPVRMTYVRGPIRNRDTDHE